MGQVDAKIVLEAMEQVRVKDVEAWTKKQLGSTLLAKRRQAFGSNQKNDTAGEMEPELAGIIEEKAACF